MRANGSHECAPDDKLREAIQKSDRVGSMDCFVASLLATTADKRPCSRGTIRTRVMHQSSPKRGRGECRAPSQHPRPRVQRVESTRVSHHRSAGFTRHSRTRMVLTAYFALFPAIGLSCHRHRRSPACRTVRADLASRQLDASVEASEPHDFAVREPRPRRKRNPRPSHPAPTYVTIAIRPSCGAGRR